MKRIAALLLIACTAARGDELFKAAALTPDGRVFVEVYFNGRQVVDCDRAKVKKLEDNRVFATNAADAFAGITSMQYDMVPLFEGTEIMAYAKHACEAVSKLLRGTGKRAASLLTEEGGTSQGSGETQILVKEVVKEVPRNCSSDEDVMELLKCGRVTRLR